MKSSKTLTNSHNKGTSYSQIPLYLVELKPDSRGPAQHQPGQPPANQRWNYLNYVSIYSWILHFIFNNDPKRNSHSKPKHKRKSKGGKRLPCIDCVVSELYRIDKWQQLLSEISEILFTTHGTSLLHTFWIASSTENPQQNQTSIWFIIAGVLVRCWASEYEGLAQALCVTGHTPHIF